MQNYKLTESKIGEANVVVDILPFGKTIKGTKMSKITHITIHDTGNDAPAKNQHSCNRNWNNSGDRIASWHLSVDWDSIYQSALTNIRCIHAGNANSVSVAIEISQSKDAKLQEKAYRNAIALTKILMAYHNIPIKNVVQHNYWTGKDCPYNMRRNKFGLNWDWFKNQLGGNSTPTPPSDNNSTNKDGFVLKLQKELNIQGFRDKNGNKVVEDGIAGPLTLSACPLVKEGARGNITRLIQEKIGTPVDGIFGRNTKTKVMDYQRSKGIGADGIVGNNTWRKMLNL